MSPPFHLRSRILLMFTVAAGVTFLDASHADPVTGLTTFTSGTPARATEVNANFTAVKSAVDNNHSRIVALEARINSPQFEALMSIAPYVSVVTLNGQPALRISSANVQIVNGLNRTLSTNGTGNLILGYDEPRPASATPECSIGFEIDEPRRVRTQADCAAVNGTWEINHKNGSHNLIVGVAHNYAASASIAAGYQNSVAYDSAVAFGMENHAVSPGASATGGFRNWAFEIASSVSGGSENEAVGPVSSISGGFQNLTGGFYSSIGGGTRNFATGAISSVTGGLQNRAIGNNSSVSGGERNSALATGSSVLGGVAQSMSTANGTIPALP
jgi:hypothetical protein